MSAEHDRTHMCMQLAFYLRLSLRNGGKADPNTESEAAEAKWATE